MRILFVANHNPGFFSPFVLEQAEALRKKGIEIDFYGVEGKGSIGYLCNLTALKQKIHTYRPQLIHAHYGLCGLLANLQREVPVVTTFHGSDIHSKGINLMLSRLAIALSAHSIFVSDPLLQMAGMGKRRSSVIPCGVNTTVFQPMDKAYARQQLGWDNNSKKVLFAGAFDKTVKNTPLAQESVKLIQDAQLIELKGYSREEVALLLNAVDALLMTSLNEGSPQIIKEALCCGCPIVSVKVGDITSLIAGIEGCFLVERNAQEIASRLKVAFTSQRQGEGRNRILESGLDNTTIATKITSIYQDLIQQ